MDQADRPPAPDPEPRRLARALQSGDRRLTFRFIQFEFPWALGPPDGRYVVREPGSPGEKPSHVVVLRTLGAVQRHLIRRRASRRSVPAEPEPEPVTTSRATVIDAIASPDAEHARGWMSKLKLSDEGASSGALEVLNRTLYGHRVASASAQVHEVAAEQALVVRAGFGAGDEVADGHWAEAIELARPGQARPSRRRDAALRPQERLAALLGGHDRPLACEELALRARNDLEHGRVCEGLLGLDAALHAAVVELVREPGRAKLDERVAELQTLAPEVSSAADAALGSPAPAGEPEIARRALGRLEAALRARSAAGVGPTD